MCLRISFSCVMLTIYKTIFDITFFKKLKLIYNISVVLLVFRLFSIIGYYKIVNIVLYAIQ